MKVRDIIKKVEEDGWVLVRMRGSHRVYKHPQKSGHVTIPGHPSDEVRPGTLDNIYKQAQIPKEK
jgi:predicted RNA binding protein YcfA (HicA-like mRNA interferase family)